MTFSLKRVNAILQKDFKDISRNSAVSITVLTPLILAFIFGKMGDITIEAHYLIINFTLATVGSFTQCSLIAEEKEKNTLRGLMLSPASTLEILGGKSLLSFIATMVIVMMGAFITGYHPENIIVIVVAIMLSSFFFIGLGTLLGLFAKSVMSASVIVLPFVYIFGFGSMLTVFVDKYPILKVMDYIPSTQLMDIAEKMESGVGLGGVWLNFGIITLWILAVFSLTAIVFQRRRMD